MVIAKPDSAATRHDIEQARRQAMTTTFSQPQSAMPADATGGFGSAFEAPSATDAPPAGSAQVIRAIVSACSGNLVEWFD
ncbi:MAG: hypothetical protein JF586_21555, partial [Burkholderiales bacterium]|nr:hypothetical protein [Burkholderiales bacterium]